MQAIGNIVNELRQTLDFKFIFIFLWIASMPFFNLGGTIFDFNFTLSDISLICLFLLIFEKQAFFDFCKSQKYFIFFIISVLPGLFICKSIFLFTYSFFQLIYGFIVFFVVLNLFNKYRNTFIVSLIFGFAITTLPLIIEILFNKVLFLSLHRGYEWKRYEAWFQYPNRFAMYFHSSILLFFLFSKKVKFSFFINLGLCLIASIVLLISGSRAFLLMVPIYFFLIGIELFSKKEKSMFYTYAIGLISTFLFMIFIGRNSSSLSHTSFRLLNYLSQIDLFNPTFYSALAKERIVDKALDVFVQFPIFGVSLGNFPLHNDTAHSIHNLFISLLTEVGVIGFLAFSTFLYLISKKIIFPVSQFSIFHTLIFCSVLIPNLSGNYLFERWSWLLLAILFFQSGGKKIDF